MSEFSSTANIRGNNDGGGGGGDAVGRSSVVWEEEEGRGPEDLKQISVASWFTLFVFH